ncbi:hypothetical protein EJB05_14825, partial [Eragrostis curvula]
MACPLNALLHEKYSSQSVESNSEAVSSGLQQALQSKHKFIFGLRPVVACQVGQYKALRLIDRFTYPQPLCEVFTLDDGSDARWRGQRPAPDEVDLSCWSQVSFKGVVYFLLRDGYLDSGQIRIASALTSGVQKIGGPLSKDP